MGSGVPQRGSGGVQAGGGRKAGSSVGRRRTETKVAATALPLPTGLGSPPGPPPPAGGGKGPESVRSRPTAGTPGWW